MNAIHWIMESSETEPPNDFYCPTRDVGQARVEKLVSELIHQDWSEGEAGLLSAIIGEIVGNCFDHNLGQWRDIPGCWLETNTNKTEFSAIVADRGQGVFNSLKRALPDLQNDQEALRVAFTQKISGRAPEQRGNGLKFIIHSLNYFNGVTLQYVSGLAMLSVENQKDLQNISHCIKEADSEMRGTYVYLVVKKTV